MKPSTLPRIAPSVAGERPWEAPAGLEVGRVEDEGVEDEGVMLVVDNEVSTDDEGVAAEVGVGVGLDSNVVGGGVRPP